MGLSDLNGATQVVASFGTNTTTTVAASATAVQVLAAKATRKNLFLKNTSTIATIYVRLGVVATAAATDQLHDIEIPPRKIWEWDGPMWVGALNAIWSTVNGSLIVSEGE